MARQPRIPKDSPRFKAAVNRTAKAKASRAGKSATQLAKEELERMKRFGR